MVAASDATKAVPRRILDTTPLGPVEQNAGQLAEQNLVKPSLKRSTMFTLLYFPHFRWCPRRDSNSHTLRRRILNSIEIPCFQAIGDSDSHQDHPVGAIQWESTRSPLQARHV
jgi:hypothetical protein